MRLDPLQWLIHAQLLVPKQVIFSGSLRECLAQWKALNADDRTVSHIALSENVGGKAFLQSKDLEAILDHKSFPKI